MSPSVTLSPEMLVLNSSSASSPLVRAALAAGSRVELARTFPIGERVSVLERVTRSLSDIHP